MKYKVTTSLWLYPGMSAWYFVTIPKKISAEIKEKFKNKQRAWGSLPITATIEKTSWKTSIFFDTKHNAFLLPVKAEIRKKEKIFSGDEVSLQITI